MAASHSSRRVARVVAFHSSSKSRPHGGLPQASLGQLRWQCRRGMRELDELLTNFLDREYDGAGAGEKAAFQSLLELPDPDLTSYLLQQRMPPPELAIVLQRILQRTDA